MATLLPWDLVDPLEATLTVRDLPDPYTDDLIDVLPDVNVASNKARLADTSRRHMAATFRTWDAESPIATRQTAFSASEVEFPPISLKIPLKESERLDLYFLNQQGTTPVLDQDLINQAYDDFSTLTEQIRNRMALARASSLFTGKFTLSGENGLYLETDWGFQSGQKPTAGTLWTTFATATPIDDETAWNYYLATTAYRRPVRAFTTLAIMQALQKNPQYKLAAYPGVANASNIGTLTPEQVNQVRVAYGFAPITVVEHAIYDYTGSATRLVPAGKFLLVCDNIGSTQWGVTADALDLIKAAQLTRDTAPGLIAGTWYSTDPVQKWTKVSGVGMPVITDYRGVLTATVG
jgi:hypothetical protein